MKKTCQYYLENKKHYSCLDEHNSILEIGSGSGGFLKFLKFVYRKNQIYSVDKSQTNVKFLQREFPNYRFYLDVDSIKNKKFDLIAGFMIFEHINKPTDFLKKLCLLLNKNGKILLEIPNKNEPLFKYYKCEAYEKFYYQKQHHFIYSKKSLEIIAEMVGLKIKKFYFVQNYGLDNHLSWVIYKKKRDYSDFTKILNFEVQRKYKKILVRNKTTDTLGVVFEKQD